MNKKLQIRQPLKSQSFYTKLTEDTRILDLGLDIVETKYWSMERRMKEFYYQRNGKYQKSYIHYRKSAEYYSIFVCKYLWERDYKIVYWVYYPDENLLTTLEPSYYWSCNSPIILKHLIRFQKSNSEPEILETCLQSTTFFCEKEFP